VKINGNYLINIGFKPSKWFKEAIEYINQRDLNETEIIDYLEQFRIAEIPLLSKSKQYFRNIRSANDLEQKNIDNVCESMDVLMKTPTVVTGAVMPDACPAGPKGTIPVGGVVVTKNSIHPGMHSADICCSVMATDCGIVNPKDVLDSAFKATHFGPGGYSKDESPYKLPEELLEKFKGNYYLNSSGIIDCAHTHLGTQGDGNHFLFVGKSENNGHTFIITHHGSRGVGGKLFKRAMKDAVKYCSEHSPATMKENAWLSYDTYEGKIYWDALQIVREWTKLNHTCIHEKIVSMSKLSIINRFWNEHNFVFKDGDMFYHAKGATPMNPVFMPDISGPRIIPLNMREPILFVDGPVRDTSLGFAPHGAGRNMSRSQHKRLNDGKSHEDIFKTETSGLDARFYSGEIDISELPSAYKNAQNIQDQITHFGLGNVVDRIQPYGCIMSGEWKKNPPWKK
jgi:tRNA-splicing ligase RtcB (3'-phosphate/5'-hydroxy nucleic acid ligase)